MPKSFSSKRAKARAIKLAMKKDSDRRFFWNLYVLLDAHDVVAAIEQATIGLSARLFWTF